MSSRGPSELRRRRHFRLRKKVVGTSERPRLAVFRSAKHISVQVIDDASGTTVASASTMADRVDGSNKTEMAASVGLLVAERALAVGVTAVVFDRGGFAYHGRVAALADAVRRAGIRV